MVTAERHVRPMRALGLVLVACLLFCAPVAAQLGISPIIIEMRAHPGAVGTFRLNITNTGKQPLECSVRVSSMAVRAGGLPVEVEDAPRSCKDWITVNPQKFTLKRTEGKRLICRVRVPKDTGGGYYAIISTHGVPQAPGGDEGRRPGVAAGIKLTHRGLVPVMLTVPAPRIRAIIDAAVPIIKAAEGGRGYTLDLPVRNRGNIHCRMGGTVEVRSDAGQLIKRFTLEAGRGFILPMHERLFKSRMRVNLPDGVYLAKIDLSTKGAAPMRTAFPFYIKQGRPTVAKLTEELKAKLMKESAGFTVTPLQMLVSLRPGGRRMQAVELVNMTRKAIPVQVSLIEWYRTPTGRDLVSSVKPPHGRSGIEWIALRDEKIELRPLSRQRVPLTVSLPKAATGERYAAVTFDRTDVKLDASLAARARRSALLRLWAEGTGMQIAEVTDFRAARKPNGMVELAVRFKNTGDLSIAPEASFSIQDADGRTIGKASPSAASFAVQAGGEGVVSAQWPRVLEPGTYTVQGTLRFSASKPPIVRRTKFTVLELPQAQTGPATIPSTDKAETRPSAKEPRK